ncbi:hypothetical protein P9E05_01990 [Bacillus mojavensis]|uniref:hypothetical protein n=1 Tax=Bacillus mojavensis TaxID=72360 RepID=UPI002DB716EF|nr:hypothetical protein [Bacillus mojavensis]MEC1690296.1 hypothetical protein [Bacillus mojavensis]
MKPTITKEQAEAIEVLRSTHDLSDEWFLLEYADVHFGSGPEIPEFGPIASMDIMTLAAALVNGYEVEKTPEEKVREYYEAVQNLREERYLAGDTEGKRFHAGALVGICTTLGIFGIKIEGVNA